jgi:hypothetical protein
MLFIPVRVAAILGYLGYEWALLPLQSRDGVLRWGFFLPGKLSPFFLLKQ